MSILDDWAAGGLIDVTLPSGLRIRGRMPAVQDLVVGRLAPATLLTAALPLLGREVAGFDEEERATWIEWQRIQAAAFIREAWDPTAERFEPAVVTPLMLTTAPPEDVDALEDLILRRRTAGQVTAAACYVAGKIDIDELKRITATEAASTVTAWTSFRPDAAGPADRADRPDVADPAKRAASDQRPRRRTRPRPGAGSPPPL